MNANLIELLEDYFPPNVIVKTSSLLGESENGVATAIKTAIPTILNGLVNKSRDSNCLNNIIDLAKQNKPNDNAITSDASSIIAPTANSNTIEFGAKLLRELFGKKQTTISNMISNVSGVRSESAATIFGMVATLLLVQINKTSNTLVGLNKLILTEEESIVAVAPAGLFSLMGLSKNKKNNVVEEINSVKSENIKGFPKWIIPVTFIFMALGLLYFLTNKCQGGENNIKLDTKVINVTNTNKK